MSIPAEIRTDRFRPVLLRLTKACSRRAALPTNRAGLQNGVFVTTIRMVNIALVITVFLPRLFKICERRSDILRRMDNWLRSSTSTGLPDRGQEILLVFSDASQLPMPASWPLAQCISSLGASLCEARPLL